MKIDASHHPYRPATHIYTHTHSSLSSLSTALVRSHAWCSVSCVCVWVGGQRRRRQKDRLSWSQDAFCLLFSSTPHQQLRQLLTEARRIRSLHWNNGVQFPYCNTVLCCQSGLTSTEDFTFAFANNLVPFCTFLRGMLYKGCVYMYVCLTYLTWCNCVPQV